MSLLNDNATRLSDLSGAEQKGDTPMTGDVLSGGLPLHSDTRRVPAGLRVLLVEDEPLIAIDGEDILRALGVDEVTRARSVAEGMHALDNNAYHAALLDLRLGQESSLPLAQRLAAMGVPFGFLTGFQDNAIAQEFRDRPVVAKPFTPAQLEALVLNLVGPV
jgi:DNA-binding response OmpR family regulator